MKNKMGDKWYAGYYTSDTDEEELVAAKTKEVEEKILDDDGKEIVIELDKDELFQQEFEAATEEENYKYVIP